VRPTDETVRDASRALKDKAGGAVEWQLVWDLMRAGRSETARELFYQRTSRTPSVTGLWEQWARFELLQGDAERARGLYRAALLHAEGRPRARAESLRKWAVMEFGAGESANAAGLFERALCVLQEAEEAAAAAEECEVDGGGSGSHDDEYGFTYDESDDICCVSGGDDKDGGGVTERVAAESAASLRAAQAVVLHAWSQANSRVGALERARQLLDQAAECDVNNPRVAHSLAQLDEASGDFEGARARYAAAAATHPADSFVVGLLALTHSFESVWFQFQLTHIRLTHSFESAWFQPFKLKCDNLVSKFYLFKWVSLRAATAWRSRAPSWSGKCSATPSRRGKSSRKQPRRTLPTSACCRRGA
jgi:GTP pyrophosphokinase